MSLIFPFSSLYCFLWQFSSKCDLFFYSLFGRRQCSLPHLLLVRENKPSVCRPYKWRRFLCDVMLHRIEIIFWYHVSSHTAFLKGVQTSFYLSLSCRMLRGWDSRSDEPSSALPPYRQDVSMCTKRPIIRSFCEVGRSFCLCAML